MRNPLLLTGAHSLLTACSGDPDAPGLEYMPDMYRSPAVEAYVDYGQDPYYFADSTVRRQRLTASARYAPEGTIAFADEQFPPAVREAAFSLKPGEYTRGPIRTGEFVHILQLERRIPSETRFEDVRDLVRRKLEERNMVKLMKEMVENLYRQADVRVLDRELRTSYEALLKDAVENMGQALP